MVGRGMGIKALNAFLVTVGVGVTTGVGAEVGIGVEAGAGVCVCDGAAVGLVITTFPYLAQTNFLPDLAQMYF